MIIRALLLQVLIVSTDRAGEVEFDKMRSPSYVTMPINAERESGNRQEQINLDRIHIR